MQYLIQASGNVLDKQSKTYVVNSKSEAEAREIAKERFSQEFDVVDGVVYSPQKRTYKAIAALVCLFIPIFLSFIGWRSEGAHDYIAIAPDGVSVLYALIIYGSFVIRFKGVGRTINSLIDILLMVFVVLLLSSFIRTLTVSNTINVLGFFSVSIDTRYLMPIIILLSMIGLKFVSVICMIIIVIIALFNISSLNVAMGSFWGTAYILFAFLGLLFYVAVEPVFSESCGQVKDTIAKAGRFVKSDISFISNKINRRGDSLKRTEQATEATERIELK